jgi:FKBP-type peptidyl-prolyl cis-trans isomerase SlyD
MFFDFIRPSEANLYDFPRILCSSQRLNLRKALFMSTQKRVISFHYTLTDSSGEVIDTSRDQNVPFSYLEGMGQIIPGLERALALLSVGDKRKIEVAAADAYGVMDDQLIVQVPREKLPNSSDLQEGDQFQASGPNGEVLLFRVIEIQQDQVKLDGNHPLAGEDLVFDVELLGVRDATPEELAHGHAHGEGGHHHH